MKKIAIVLALAASFFAFAGCASKSADQATVDQTPVQHDYKGETSHAK